ncbi:DUF7344 domain-containing protein [Halobaculum limi]|uniref:DUF7344 domain-containing protein n=1 Tax=Halobaculum limi TaxID=3031916 RepID=UPI0024071B6C|nr:hypothetical protein [Halobaculum sp. YSMS11]
MPADETLSGVTDRPATVDSADRYPATANLDESARHRLLSAARRRHALDVFEIRSNPVTLRALAAAIAAREDVDPADEAERRSIAIALHHVHLPMLADYGVVEYDSEEKTIWA